MQVGRMQNQIFTFIYEIVYVSIFFSSTKFGLVKLINSSAGRKFSISKALNEKPKINSCQVNRRHNNVKNINNRVGADKFYSLVTNL